MFRPGPPTDERELPRRFRFAGLEVDVPAARVYRGGAALAVEPRAFDVLLLLAANPGRVVGKEEIFARLWGGAFVTDNALTRVVAHLRQQLGDRAEAPAVIETLRTRGYRFLPPIEAVSEPVAAPDAAPAAARAPEPLVAGPAVLEAPSAAGVAAAAPPAADLPPASAAVMPPNARPPRPVPPDMVASRLRRLGPWFLAGLAVALAGLWLSSRARTAAATPAVGPPVQRTVDAGAQLDPAFSPDGSQLVFVRDAVGGLEIFVRPLEGGRALQLTADGPNVEPAWSPDGRWIAYRNLRRGGLWLVAPTGGEVRQITTFGTQPAWSPDGRVIVFSHPGNPALGSLEWPASHDSALWRVDVASGAVRQLTWPSPEAGGHGMPAFSPDGKWVVYATANLLGGGGVWSVPSGGGTPVPLLAPPAAGAERALWHDPQPAPDGRGLYVLRVGRDSRVVRLGWSPATPPEEVLAPAPLGTTALALSRDGRQLAFAVTRAETRIEELRVDPSGRPDGAPRVLVAPTVRRVTMPRYSPDGRRLLVYRLRAGSSPEWMIVDAQGREERIVPASRHGEWLSAAEVVVVTDRGAIRVDVLTGRQHPYPREEWATAALALGRPRHVQMRPDLQAAALTAPRGAGRELMVWSAGAPAPRQLTRLGGVVDYPFWSDDARWIGFQHIVTTRHGNELWRVAAAGNGAPQRIRTAAGPSWGGSFSPDGSAVVYAAFRGGRWHLAVAGPDREETFLPVPPESQGYLRWPDWSPEGGRIAYERMRYAANLWTVELAPER